MGGFILFHKNTNLLIEEAMQVFSRKRLTSPRRFDLGSWILFLYRKMLVANDNFLVDVEGNSIFCCGTVSYRGLGYKASLASLLAEHQSGAIDRTELVGNFCLLFWNRRTLSLMTDQLSAQHIFVNEQYTCLSSSFLALSAANPYSLRLNRRAAYEKLATGYLVSPDTLVDGIYQLNHDLFQSLEQKSGIKILNNPPPDGGDIFHNKGLKDSVDSQLTVLKDYFRKIEKLAREFRAELGLSNGYDSRLLLALAQSFPSPIPLHSHHTTNVHESELAIARELASIGSNEMRIISTERLEDQEEVYRRQVIIDNLYFFDGRCINDMGSFSETYTAQYRIQVLGDNRLSLHGLGGEIYRNVYATPLGHFIWNDWLDYAVFYPFAREVCETEEAFVEMRKHKNAKIGGRLDVDLTGRVDFHTIRRYYGLVRMPDSASNVSNAYNQVAFLLAPFIEPMPVWEALKATPYIGTNGEYEAAMIHELAPHLASVNSQYGHSFSAIPLKYVLKSRLINKIPLRLRSDRQRRLNLDPRRNPDSIKYQQLRLQSRFVQEIEAVLRDVFPKADWDMVMKCHTQKCTSISVGSFLLEFQHKLRF